MVHSHPSGDGGGFPSSYPSISPFLSPYYWIPPHLRSSSRRPKSFRRSRKERGRKKGEAAAMKAGGEVGGERKREKLNFWGAY